MIKRPLCLVCLLLVCQIFFLYRTGNLKLPAGPEKLDSESVQIQGEIYKYENKNQNSLLYLKNVSILSKELSNQVYFYNYNVLAYIPQENIPVKIGNSVFVSGTCMIPEKASNPGQFDRLFYYQQRGIGFLMQKSEYRILDHRYNRYREGLSRFRARLKENLFAAAEDNDAALLSAMILGDTAELDSDLKDAYRRAGIAHILSISGLHISFLGMAVFKGFRKTGLPYAMAGILSGVFMFSYVIMTGMSPSACRAVFMFLVYLGAQAAGRTYDLLSALSLAAILMLLTTPAYLFHAGFLLSFLSVLGIALIHPVLKNVFPVKHKIMESLLLSCSIQLMILPWILFFYFEFSIYGIFLNLIVLPGVSVILLSGMLGGMLGFLSPEAGIAAAGAAHYIFKGYSYLSEMSIKLPGNMQVWGAPAAGRIAAYYIILGGVLLTLKYTGQVSKWIRKGEAVFAGIVLILLMSVKLRKNLDITFLDVGQGDSIYWRTPAGTTYLCDGGSSNVSQVGKYRLEPFLKYQGTRKIDYLFLTHMDADHINGIEELLADENGIQIANLILPDIDREDEAYQRIESLAKKRQIPLSYFQAGMGIKEGELSLRCLYPDSMGAGDDKNENSLVLKMNYGRFSALLTGDLEGRGEEQLVQSGLLEKVEVLKVAHHGSKGATKIEFLDQTRPGAAVLSYGVNNAYGHPHQELLERLDGTGCDIYATAENGAVTLSTDGNFYQLKGFMKNKSKK